MCVVNSVLVQNVRSERLLVGITLAFSRATTRVEIASNMHFSWNPKLDVLRKKGRGIPEQFGFQGNRSVVLKVIAKCWRIGETNRVIIAVGLCAVSLITNATLWNWARVLLNHVALEHGHLLRNRKS